MLLPWKQVTSGVLAVGVLLTIAACKGDDDSNANVTTDTTATATATAMATTTSAETTAATVAAETATTTIDMTEVAAADASFCSALVAFDGASPPGGEESDEAYVQAIKDYADVVDAPLTTMRDSAPPEVADALATLGDLLPRLHAGEIEAYESPEGSSAIEAIEQVAASGCGWETVEVTATDYHFELDHDAVPAGPISFHLTNEGTEPHVFLLIRKPEGDTRELPEIVGEFLEQISSGDPAQIAEVAAEDVPGGGPFAVPGASGSHVLDLAPGTYIYWCPIPQDPPEGAPHFMLGMIGELSVS